MTRLRRKPRATLSLPMTVRPDLGLLRELLLDWAEAEIAYPVRRCWKHIDHPDCETVVDAAQQGARSIVCALLRDWPGGGEG